MSTADPQLVAAVAAALEDALPEIAVLVAERTTERAVAAPEPPDASTTALETQLRDLLAAHPGRQCGDTTAWIGHALRTAAVDVALGLRWAWDSTCPTRWWAQQHALPTPRAVRGTRVNSRSELDQLLAEYSSAQTDAGLVALVALDGTVDAIRDLIAAHSAAPTAVVNQTWRRNTLALLTHHDGDHELVVAVLRWCLQHRPHWQRAIRKPPTVATFARMRADFRHDGQEWSLDSVPEPIAATVTELAQGWEYYLRTVGIERPVTTRTLRNLHLSVTGSDEYPAVPVTDIQQLIRWWLRDGNIRFLPFHRRDADFPDQDTVRRELLAMRTAAAARPGNGVAATNEAAAGRGTTELAELRGLA